MKKMLILGANGQISKILIKRLIKEQLNVELTLYLKNSSRLKEMESDKINIIEGDVEAHTTLKKAMEGQDLVFVGFVDHHSDNVYTKNIIKAMIETNVNRVIVSNVLGIYDEVLGEFGRWNKEMIGSGLPSAIESDRLYEKSGLNYTTLRLPWLNDRNEINYTLTLKNENYVGVSGSRKSMVDVILRIVKDNDFLSNQSVGIADEKTEGESRPVY